MQPVAQPKRDETRSILVRLNEARCAYAATVKRLEAAGSDFEELVERMIDARMVYEDALHALKDHLANESLLQAVTQ